MTATAFGQSYKQITTKTETYYWLTDYDTINFKPHLPDGRWKIFHNQDTSQLEYVFHLKDNKVTGPFFHINKFGSHTYGNYYQDSLWTFLFKPQDTIFRTGYWTMNVQGIKVLNRVYKIPYYDSSGLYTEKWFYYNGQQCFQRTYKKGGGITEEIWWHFQTKNISRHLINKPNYSILTTYSPNDSIEFISITQGLTFDNTMSCSKHFYGSGNGISVTNKNGTRITDVSYDSDNKVDRFVDGSNGLQLTYDRDGNVDISYIDKKGHWKNKKVHIRQK